MGAILLVFYTTYCPLPTETKPIYFYSSHCRDDLRATLLQAIKNAHHSIHIHTFALTDPQILSALIKKAKQGVEVHITYHQKNTPRLTHLPHLFLHPEKGKGLMHAKWMIVDEKMVILGTANLTPSSLLMHENFLVGLYAPEFAKSLLTASFYEGKIGNQLLTFYLLPDDRALTTLLETLDQASKSVHLAMFTFTHPLLVQKLLDLKKRGVAPFITLDQQGARGASKKATLALKEGNIVVKTNQGLPLFHHKWAIVDQKIFILGSANWTQAAFTKNKDFILFLSPLNKKQIKYLNKVSNIIKKESLNCN